MSPVYLVLSILDRRKLVIYNHWYDYVKAKYGIKTKLCYKDTDNFIVYLIPDDNLLILLEILRRDLTYLTMNSKDHYKYKKKKKRKIGSMKDELSGKILNEFLSLKSKVCSFLADDVCIDRKVTRTMCAMCAKCAMKREIKFEDYNRCLESNKAILRFQRMFKSALHNVFTKKMNNIVLSLNDYKRMQK